MAKIVLSDDAPKGKLRFSLANAEVEELPYESNDPEVLSNAAAHPWLNVEYDPAVELSENVHPFPQVQPEDDALSAENSVANDPEAVKAALPKANESDPVAIDAGLDQKEVVETEGGIDLTVAAERVDESSERRSASKKEKE